MQISNVQLSAGATISIPRDPALQDEGLVRLSPLITSIAAQWASIDKILDAFYVLITDDDGERAQAFRSQRGFDARRKKIEEAAKALSQDVSRRVSAVVRQVKTAANKRDELMHGIWGVSPQHPGTLILLPPDYYVRCARIALDARAGKPFDNLGVLQDSVVVTLEHLVRARDELLDAHELAWHLLLSLMPPSLDITGGEFKDAGVAIEEHGAIADRIANM